VSSVDWYMTQAARTKNRLWLWGLHHSVLCRLTELARSVDEVRALTDDALLARGISATDVLAIRRCLAPDARNIRGDLIQ
jgi:hypothetical protein